MTEFLDMRYITALLLLLAIPQLVDRLHRSGEEEASS